MATIDPQENSDNSYSSYEEIDKSEVEMYQDESTNDDTYLLINNDDENENGELKSYCITILNLNLFVENMGIWDKLPTYFIFINAVLAATNWVKHF